MGKKKNQQTVGEALAGVKKGTKKQKNKGRKLGRSKRKPSGGQNQAMRTYQNKLKRVNREREKAGWPLLATLPTDSKAYRKAFKPKA